MADATAAAEKRRNRRPDGGNSSWPVLRSRTSPTRHSGPRSIGPRSPNGRMRSSAIGSARRLAGERGERIAATMPFFEQHAWTWVTRTYLFDQFITEQVEQGVDLVLNLAAGLDARPYRMALPPSLRWVEVDLPELLAYKEEVLAGEKPVCELERVALDLANAERTPRAV